MSNDIDVEKRRLNYIEKTKNMAALIKAIPVCPYAIDVAFDEVEHILERYNRREGGLQMNPDFQRGHVWNREQQIAYIESFIRGAIGDTGRTITLTCSDFQRERAKDSDLVGFYVVDGLQRLTAVLAFMNDEFHVFNDLIDGGADKDSFNGTAYQVNRMTGLRFNVFNMQYKKDVLDYYIALNAGGVVHSKEEIDRVKAMRDEL